MTSVSIIRKNYVSLLTQKKNLQKQLELLPKGKIYSEKKKVGNTIYTYYVHQFYQNDQRILRHVKRVEEKELLEQFEIKNALLDRIQEVSEEITCIHQIFKSLNLDPEIVKKEERQRIRSLRQRKTLKQEKLKTAKNQDKYHNRKHITANGLIVRSRGEVILLDLLDQYDVRFEYEKKVVINGVTLCPDVTIEKDQDVIYWEHCGLPGTPDYDQRWAEKKALYAEAGILEGKNLIVTYDNEDGSIDAENIRYLIETYLL